MNRNSFLAATAATAHFAGGLLACTIPPVADSRRPLLMLIPACRRHWRKTVGRIASGEGVSRAQLDALIDNAIQHSPDMQVAEQRIPASGGSARRKRLRAGRPQLTFLPT